MRHKACPRELPGRTGPAATALTQEIAQRIARLKAD